MATKCNAFALPFFSLYYVRLVAKVLSVKALQITMLMVLFFQHNAHCLEKLHLST